VVSTLSLLRVLLTRQNKHCRKNQITFIFQQEVSRLTTSEAKCLLVGLMKYEQTKRGNITRN